MADEQSDPSVRPAAPHEVERTIVRPRQGARTGGAERAARSDPYAAQAADSPLDESAQRVGDNPLLWRLEPLLAAAAQLRRLPSHPDPVGLREQLTRSLHAFEREAAATGITRDRIIAARYIVCTFLDESVASTPWGGAGVWARDTLLVRFHNEAWGGEKVFQLLGKLLQSPAENRDLIELIYVCIALGFEGRYRVINSGRAQLEQVHERVYQALRQVRESPEKRLSPHAEPARGERRRAFDATPFWAFCALIAVLAVGLYAFYAFKLGGLSDAAFAAVQNVRLPAPMAAAAAPAAAPPAPKPRLARFLEPEIREGLVAVRDEAGRSVVTIRGDGMFEPGRAEVIERVKPVVDRVAQALLEHPGQVVISGHSDNQPIRSARFPSNWHLSQERARAVEQLLAARVPAQRLRAEGRADSEPIGPNDTSVNRARNRRVEITLLAQPQ